jgi:predicted Zn-dependent protease
VIFRRILLLLALLAAACTPDGAAPPNTAARGVPALPREVERAVGGQVYRDPAVAGYVEGVGRRVADRSSLGGGFRFYVLDMPSPNAHALPSGHIFVTRGLLALLDDEAELAAALAHEMGHIARRHPAERERQRQTAIDNTVAAARVTGSTTVASSVAREGMMALRRYSRDQELDADRTGLAYIRQAGYRGDAMLSLIEKLQRYGRLEAQFFGEAPDTADRRSATSTHPAAVERMQALRSLDLGGGGDTGREAYLKAIDGITFDDGPQEGFVRGNSFLHPVLKIAFQAPGDFRLFNDHDGVLGMGSDRSLMYFTCTDDEVKGPLVDWMRNEVKPTPSDIQATEIGGAEAAIGERPRGADTSLSNFRQVLIRRPNGICFFNLLADRSSNDRRIEAMVAAARTFRTLSDSEAASLRPFRLRVMATAGHSPQQLAAGLPYPDLRLERLLTLNGVDSAADLARKGSIKVVER